MRKAVRLTLCLLILLRGWVGGGMVAHATPSLALWQSVGVVATDPSPATALPATGAAAEWAGASHDAAVHPPGCPGAVADDGEGTPSAGGCQLCTVCHGPALAAAPTPALTPRLPATAPATSTPRLGDVLLPAPTEPPIS